MHRKDRSAHNVRKRRMGQKARKAQRRTGGTGEKGGQPKEGNADISMVERWQQPT